MKDTISEILNLDYKLNEIAHLEEKAMEQVIQKELKSISPEIFRGWKRVYKTKDFDLIKRFFDNHRINIETVSEQGKSYPMTIKINNKNVAQITMVINNKNYKIWFEVKYL